jgi:Glycosyl hydrolases family 25
MLLLPDLSEYQPAASMPGIKAANGGAAIIRACYGTSHFDAAFHRLRAAASDFPFLGLYMYVTAGQDIAAQARAFTAIVGELAPHEVPILDLEEGTGNQEARANAWLTVVDEALGLASRPLNERSWLYSNLDFAGTAGLTPIFASARHTWVAAYGPAEPSLGHTLWQSTNGTTGSNITDWPGAGRCDTNLYHGTLAQLAALSGRYPTAATASAAPATHVTTGYETLAAVAAARRVTPAVILELTARAPGGYSGPTAAWLDDVFAGTAHPYEPMPKGLTLVLPKS